MGSFSDFTEGNVLDAVFKIATFSQAANLRVALFQSDPTDAAGGGTEVPVANAYTRVTFNTWVRTTNTVSNNGAITFPTATGSWGTVTHFAIFDDAGTPNKICHGSVSPSQAIVNGNTPSFPSGALTVTLD